MTTHENKGSWPWLSDLLRNRQEPKGLASASPKLSGLSVSRSCRRHQIQEAIEKLAGNGLKSDLIFKRFKLRDEIQDRLHPRRRDLTSSESARMPGNTLLTSTTTRKRRRFFSQTECATQLGKSCAATMRVEQRKRLEEQSWSRYQERSKVCPNSCPEASPHLHLVLLVFIFLIFLFLVAFGIYI